MASSTRSRVAGLTLGRSLTTRDTVWCETPARRATSKMFATRDRVSSMVSGPSYRSPSADDGRAWFPTDYGVLLRSDPASGEKSLKQDEYQQ